MPAIRPVLIIAACIGALGFAPSVPAQDAATPAPAGTVAAPPVAGEAIATANPESTAAAAGPLRPIDMCLDPGRIRRWTAVDAHNLAVQTGDSYYHVKLDTDCSGLRDGDMLMFRPTPSTQGRMCGDAGEMVVPDSGQLCHVSAVQPLDKSGYKALLKGD